MLGKTASRHTSQVFVAILFHLVDHQPPGKEIHVVLDNLSAHKMKRVQKFLEEHPNVRLHFTPTYSSWLNQVELWSGKIQRDMIERGVFTSIQDLASKLMCYIRRNNEASKPIKWRYRDPKGRMRFTAEYSVTEK